MKATNAPYSFDESLKRLDEILDAADESFEEVDSIPSRDRLTFTNGFYCYCAALFMDIRKSSELNQTLKRPTLSRLYRAYISEAVAVVNGNPKCAEVNIVGDSVSGIFDTPLKADIDSVFSTAAELSSLIKTLNCKMKKRQMPAIRVGIGMSFGRALMIKAGFSGSAINDVVWIGPVVNEAAHLGSYGNKEFGDEEMMASNVFYQNLNDRNKTLLSYNSRRGCYHGNVVNTVMEQWYKTNCA